MVTQAHNGAVATIATAVALALAAAFGRLASATARARVSFASRTAIRTRLAPGFSILRSFRSIAPALIAAPTAPATAALPACASRTFFTLRWRIDADSRCCFDHGMGHWRRCNLGRGVWCGFRSWFSACGHLCCWRRLRLISASIFVTGAHRRLPIRIEARNRFADQLFYRGEEFSIFRGRQGQRPSRHARPAGTPNTMHIVLGVNGHVVKENMAQTLDIQAAGRDIATNQDLDFVIAEFFQGLCAVALLHVAMQGQGVKAFAL